MTSGSGNRSTVSFISEEARSNKPANELGPWNVSVGEGTPLSLYRPSNSRQDASGRGQFGAGVDMCGGGEVGSAVGGAPQAATISTPTTLRARRITFTPTGARLR